jgi:hypothetical protein
MKELQKQLYITCGNNYPSQEYIQSTMTLAVRDYSMTWLRRFVLYDGKYEEE